MREFLADGGVDGRIEGVGFGANPMPRMLIPILLRESRRRDEADGLTYHDEQDQQHAPHAKPPRAEPSIQIPSPPS